MNYRVLIVPIVTTSNDPTSDSGFYIAWETALELASKGHHCYMVLPSNMEPYRDKLLADGVTIRYTTIPMVHYATHHGVLDTKLVLDFVSPVLGEYKVDAILCFSGEHASQLMSVMNPHHKKEPAPIYTFDLGMDFYDSNSAFVNDSTKHRGQVMGYAVSHPLMCTTRELSMLDDKAKFYGMGASLREQIVSRARIATPRLDLKLIEGSLKLKNDTFTLLFAGRFNGVKRAEKIIKVFDDLYRMGKDVQVEVLTNTSAMKADLFAKRNALFAERGYITPIFEATRAQFYDHAAGAHIYVMWSESEGYPMSLAEAMFLGCIPMVHKAIWARVVFSEWEDDLFWFSTEAELKAKILWVKDNWDEAVKRVKPLLELYEADMDERRLPRVFLSNIEQWYEKNFSPDPYWLGVTEPLNLMVVGLAKSVLEKGEALRFPLSRAVRMLDQFTDQPLAANDLARWCAHRIITEYALYCLFKHHYRMVDRTDMSNVVFEINPTTAKEILENHES